MAGDWIKMRVDLDTDPSVILISQHASIDRFAVVGRLHKIWSWADTHSISGNALTVTESFLDEIVNCSGFAAAMRKAAWLEGRDGALSFPRFDRHNGQTAKSRALTSKRVGKKRLRDCNADTVTESLPEKRREEKNNTPLPPSEKNLPVPNYFTPNHAPQEQHKAAERVKDAYQREVKSSHPPAGAKNAILELIATGQSTEEDLLAAVKNFANFAKKEYPDAKMRMSARTFFGKEKSAWQDWIAGSPVEESPVFDAQAEYERIQERNRRILGV